MNESERNDDYIHHLETELAKLRSMAPYVQDSGHYCLGMTEAWNHAEVAIVEVTGLKRQLAQAEHGADLIAEEREAYKARVVTLECQLAEAMKAVELLLRELEFPGDKATQAQAESGGTRGVGGMTEIECGITYHICTKDDPWTPEKGNRARHLDAKSVGSSCDCHDAYECPNCGKYFKVELPDG